MSLGALRNPLAPAVLAGPLAHETGHVLQWDEQERTGIFNQPTYRGVKQVEAHADALGLILLERSGIGQAAMLESFEASWGCTDIASDLGDHEHPAHGDRWANVVLLRSLIEILSRDNRESTMDLIDLDAFDERGRVRGSFLSRDPKILATLDSDVFRQRIIAQGCGVPDWKFNLVDTVGLEAR